MSVVTGVFVSIGAIFFAVYIVYKTISILQAPRINRGADWKGRRNSNVGWRVHRH